MDLSKANVNRMAGLVMQGHLDLSSIPQNKRGAVENKVEELKVAKAKAEAEAKAAEKKSKPKAKPKPKASADASPE